jgi:hypothetical protein
MRMASEFGGYPGRFLGHPNILATDELIGAA